MDFGSDSPLKMEICKGQSCLKRGAKYIEARLLADIATGGLQDIDIISSACQGSCDIGPNIRIDDIQYTKQNPSKSSNLLNQYFLKK
jgi:NADH:ubiquinone oxidoreductase subunit E